MCRFLLSLLSLSLASLGIAAPPAKAPAFDPRLGEPFEVRDRPSVGSDQASIVVVEFGSYKCSHCQEFLERAFPAIDAQYIKTGKVQWFMVPSSDNPADPSGKIFAVGRCLQRQGKFWDQLDFLMTIANRPSTFLNDLIAKNPAIDSSELAFCLQDREIPRTVSKDFEEFHLLKVPGTPTFFIRKLHPDGTRTETIVRGYQPADYFQRIFDELAKTPVSARDFRSGLIAAARGVRFSRLLVLLVVSLAAALASDWLREERVVFPAPLPKFTIVPAKP